VRRHYGLTLAVLAVAGLSFALLQTMGAPALPAIQREFGASTTTVSWVLTVYLLTASIFTPIFGRLGDMFGKERLLVIVLIVLGAGTLISALSSSLAVLHAEPWHVYLSSLLMGAGIGLAFASMATLIVDAVPQTQTGVATGMNTIMRSVGGALGAQIAASIVGAHIGAAGLPAESGFVAAFLVSAGALLLAFAAALLIPRRAARSVVPHGAHRLGVEGERARTPA
jgi:MFS family permease